MDWHASVADPAVASQIEIWDRWGHDVSFIDKAKALDKFGRVTLTADTPATVMELPGSERNETLLTTNGVDAICSSEQADAGKTILREYHTIDGSGNLTFAVETITLDASDARTPVSCTAGATTTRLKKAEGTFASPATNLVGNIYAFASSGVTVTAGVPQTASAVKCMITAGEQQSRKCATAISASDYWCISQVSARVLRSTGSGAQVDFRVEIKRIGGVWVPLDAELTLRSDGQCFDELVLDRWRIVPPNSYVRMVATSSVTNIVANGMISGQLAKILNP